MPTTAAFAPDHHGHRRGRRILLTIVPPAAASIHWHFRFPRPIRPTALITGGRLPGLADRSGAKGSATYYAQLLPHHEVSLDWPVRIQQILAYWLVARHDLAGQSVTSFDFTVSFRRMAAPEEKEASLRSSPRRSAMAATPRAFSGLHGWLAERRCGTGDHHARAPATSRSHEVCLAATAASTNDRCDCWSSVATARSPR